MIEKNVIIDQITITNNGCILIREAEIITENDREISKKYKRNSYAPGQDISTAPEIVKETAKEIWTEEIIKNYKEKSNGTI